MNNENRQLDNNTGLAFENASENPSAPKFKGSINVDGKIYQIAIWIRISKANKAYKYIKINPIEQKTT
jgi:hypothetical protein